MSSGSLWALWPAFPVDEAYQGSIPLIRFLEILPEKPKIYVSKKNYSYIQWYINVGSRIPPMKDTTLLLSLKRRANFSNADRADLLFVVLQNIHNSRSISSLLFKMYSFDPGFVLKLYWILVTFDFANLASIEWLLIAPKLDWTANPKLITKMRLKCYRKSSAGEPHKLPILFGSYLF